MSVRQSIHGHRLRRQTATFPTSLQAVTVCGFFKLQTAPASGSSYVVFMQSADADSGNRLEVLPAATFRGVADWGDHVSSSLGTLTAGGASGENWYFFGWRGTGTGAAGMKVSLKPVGSGSMTTNNLEFVGVTTGFSQIILGSPFDDGQFGAFGFDGFLAHLKIFNRALTDGELAVEAAQATPAASDLLSYHSFVGSDMTAALQPTQGTGAFEFFGTAPSLDADNPVFAATPSLSGDDTLPTLESGATSPTLAGDDTLPTGGPSPVWPTSAPATITVIAGTAITGSLVAAGTPAPTYTKAGGPDWVSIDGTTGALSGTAPSTLGSGIAVFRATNSAGSADLAVTISVVANLAILTTALPTAIQGQPYSAAIALSGPEPLTLTVTGLPAGLTLLGRSVIGTPTNSAGGTAVFTVTAQGGATATRTIVIAGGAAGDPPVVTTTSLAAGTVGTAYSQTLAATGATPITWSVTGALPPGLSRSGASISGTPTAPGAWQITATATNAFGSASRVLTISAVAAAQVARRTSPWAKWLKR